MLHGHKHTRRGARARAVWPPACELMLDATCLLTGATRAQGRANCLQWYRRPRSRCKRRFAAISIVRAHASSWQPLPGFNAYRSSLTLRLSCRGGGPISWKTASAEENSNVRRICNVSKCCLSRHVCEWAGDIPCACDSCSSATGHGRGAPAHAPTTTSAHRARRSLSRSAFGL